LVIIGFITNLVLGAWFARSISRALNQIAARLSLGGTEVSAAAKQVATTSDLLASSSAQQAASLEETAASLEEITSIVANNAANARRAAELSALSSEKARSGETQVAELLSAMGEISASSRKIEEIVNVIDDIAFQTNLLALNAAVEAARAGEQGRGFAVVAEAVRALSQRSATSARDITNLISESSMKIERGVRTADASGSILKEIVSSVGEVSELNGSISQACQEQSQGVNQISQAVHQLNQVTQEQSQTSQVAAETAQILQDQSAALHETVHDLETTVRGRTARAVDFESPRSGPPDHPFSNSTESSHLGMRRAA
jgi:methyl-accepting chemotaxis protein